MTPQHPHATAPSLKVQTTERVRECLAHHAPYLDGVMRVVGCNRSLALRFSRYVARERTQDAFVSGMAAKRGDRERMLVVFRDFSRSLNSPVQGHVCAQAGLTLARRMRCKRGLVAASTPKFNSSQDCSPCGEMKRLEPVTGILDQQGLRCCTVCDRCWSRDLNDVRNCTAVALPKPLVYRRRLPAPALGDGEEGDGTAAPQPHPRARHARARHRRDTRAPTPATPGS